MLQLVLVGKITLKEATEKMGVSYRQSQRLRGAFKEKGVRGLIHGNTGRSPTNRMDIIELGIALAGKPQDFLMDLFSYPKTRSLLQQCT